MTSNSYRSALVDLLTDPMQLALDVDHAGSLIGQIEDVLNAAGWDIVSKNDRPSTRTVARVVHPTQTVTRNELVAGVNVHRYTVNGRHGWVWAEMPCCDRHAKLPSKVHTEFPVRCLPCRMDYVALLEDENDGGYLAVFEIHDDQRPILSRRRRTAKRLW